MSPTGESRGMCAGLFTVSKMCRKYFGYSLGFLPPGGRRHVPKLPKTSGENRRGSLLEGAQLKSDTKSSCQSDDSWFLFVWILLTSRLAWTESCVCTWRHVDKYVLHGVHSAGVSLVAVRVSRQQATGSNRFLETAAEQAASRVTGWTGSFRRVTETPWERKRESERERKRPPSPASRLPFTLTLEVLVFCCSVL